MPDQTGDNGNTMLFELQGKGIISFVLIFILVLFNTSTAALHERGRINIKGAIVETACTISTGSREQAVDIGSLSISDSVRYGQGDARAFSIELINCNIESHGEGNFGWKHVQIAFDGYNASGLFIAKGEPKGLALKITDHNGNVAIPGVAMPLTNINPAGMSLNYFLTLIAAHPPFKVESCFLTVQFKLDYL